VSIFRKWEVSISDTDILIHLHKADCLHVLDLLFDKVMIPKRIERELQRKGKETIFQIRKAISSGSHTIFEIVDKDRDRLLKRQVDNHFHRFIDYIDAGEAECCGYAAALSVPIIISDNTSDHQIMEQEFIVLTFRDVLALAVFFGLLPKADAESYYNKINDHLTYRSRYTFDESYDKSIFRIREKGWHVFLGLK
jgi:predicted nucleic acid-binding protein